MQGGPNTNQQVYKRVETPLMMNEPFAANGEGVVLGSSGKDPSQEKDGEEPRVPKKKKPTTVNSGSTAEAAMQPCHSQ